MKKQILLIAVLLIAACTDDSSNSFPIFDETGFNPGDIEQMETFTDFGENDFITTADQPVSIFSVDADGGSFTNSRRFINLGQRPPTAAVRIEEYLNYFTFDYAELETTNSIAINSEMASCPWQPEHYLLRLGLKGEDIPVQELPDANYVLLIDVSGSMGSPDKLELLKVGFNLMVDEMRDTDRISIVTYAGNAAVLLQPTFGDEKDRIRSAIDQLGSGGGTAGAEGIITAYELAEESFISEGNNRIILGTDGDFNIGPSSPDELVELIETERDKGVFLTVLGVGQGNLNESIMEQLANNGNGNYEYIDGIAQMDKVFVQERSKFFAVAKDTKIKIDFNSEIVDSYRLIGYENRGLTEEEFEEESTDAGEIGANQTITAVYELILKDNVDVTSIGSFEVKYKTTINEENKELLIDVPFSNTQIENASSNMRFAASVTAFGLLMKESEFGGNVSIEMVRELGFNSINFDPNGYKMEYLELTNLIQ